MGRKRLSDREELKKEAGRDMSVYKRDDLIQKARYTLTLQEQKCILYAISKIRPSDTYLNEYDFDINEFYAVCGLKSESYSELKRQLLGLKSKSWWLLMPDGQTESAVSWFDVVRVKRQSGKVTIAFHRDMMPYLLELAAQAEQGYFYTGYKLRFVLPMACQYSPRLYEILKSYQKNNVQWFFTVDELRRLLDCQHYHRWADLRRFVLMPAIKEINLYTDIRISMDVQKEGRKIATISFYVGKKKKKALVDAYVAGSEQLDGQLDFDMILADVHRKNELREQAGLNQF